MSQTTSTRERVRVQHFLGGDRQQLLALHPPLRYERGQTSPDDLLTNLFLDLFEQDVVTAQPSEDLINLVLPDEILFAIFEHLISSSANILSASLVCRRWQDATEPLLYRTLNLGSEPARVLALQKCLKRRSSLANYVWEISASNSCWRPGSAGGFYDKIAKLLCLCKATRVLTLKMQYDDEAFPVFEAIHRLSQLKYLDLSGPLHGTALSVVLEGKYMVNLNHLSLSRFGSVEGSGQGAFLAVHARSRAADQHDLHKLLPPNQYHTSSLTSVELREPIMAPQEVENFLSWPKALEKLSIRGLGRSGHSWDMPVVARILKLHFRSLRHVQLGYLWPRSSCIPDLSQFRSLEVLAVSAYNFLEVTAHEAARKLPAPSLRELKISFSSEDQMGAHPDEFGETRLRWIETFASYMSLKYPNNQLKTLHVEFSPEWYIYEHGSHLLLNTKWPWCYLEKGKKSLVEYGICLNYSAYMSEEEWIRKRSDNARWLDSRSETARANNAARKALKAARKAEREATELEGAVPDLISTWLRRT